MDTNFYNIPKIPKVPIFVANKDDVIIYRNDTARVRFSAGNCGTCITNLIDETDTDRYRALVGGYSGLDRKGVFRLMIGSKRQTAIFEQHAVDNIILRAFILLSGEYSLLKNLYETNCLEEISMDESLNILYRITEGSPNSSDSAESLAELYSQLFGAKFIICSCFGFTQMKKSTMNIPYRFMGFIDFWISYMMPKTRQIDCDITTDFSAGISEADYVSLNPCGLLVMMTALAAYLSEVSTNHHIRLSASKRIRSYSIEMSTNVNISMIAQHSTRISSLAEHMPYGSLNLLLASSVSKQCGLNLSYSIVDTQSKQLVFNFVLNDNDIGMLGFKAHTPGELDSIYMNAANVLFFGD